MKEKNIWFVNGENLSDQEFLLRWAEFGVEKYCNPKDCKKIIKQLQRAKKRIGVIMQAYIEKK